MASDQPLRPQATERSSPGEDCVRILLIVGPHAAPASLGPFVESGRTPLPALRATVDHIAANDESETVAALGRHADAVVLDPGVLEHFSRRTVDAVSRSSAPVVIARQAAETEPEGTAAHRLVTRAARASVQGGGAAAYESAVEAAAWFAWEQRHDVHEGDVVPSDQIGHRPR